MQRRGDQELGDAGSGPLADVVLIADAPARDQSHVGMPLLDGLAKFRGAAARPGADIGEIQDDHLPNTALNSRVSNGEGLAARPGGVERTQQLLSAKVQAEENPLGAARFDKLAQHDRSGQRFQSGDDGMRAAGQAKIGILRIAHPGIDQ